MLKLEQLRTFCTLIETGHFTRTAEQLAMTQPGVSQHVRKLEQHFGQNLLVRSGKSIAPTQAGEAVYAQGRALLTQLGELEQQLGRDNPHSGLCRLASPGSLGLKLYPAIVQLQQRHPQLAVHYQFAPNSSIERMLQQRQLDLGFTTRHIESDEFKVRLWGREALCLVTPQHCDDNSWQSLQNLGYVGHPDGAHHANLLLSVNYPEFEHIAQFYQRAFINNIASILQPVAAGLGFTVLPQFAVEAFAHQSQIKVHTLSVPVDESIYLLQRRHHVLGQRFDYLLQALSALAAFES